MSRRLFFVVGVLLALEYCVKCGNCAEQDSPAETAKNAVAAIAAGRQHEAEEMLESYFAEHQEIATLLAALPTQAAEVDTILDASPDRHRHKQRLIFLSAACTRSRFMVEEAYPWFMLAAIIDPSTPEGKCAEFMVKLDGRARKKLRAADFEGLSALADKTDDTVIRWMAAVQCRTLSKNEEGVKHYAKILDKWKPGPVLVHQTYANLLDELGRHEQALPERQVAVKMEPRSWSYNGLGVTLQKLRKYDEATEAYGKAVQLDPQSFMAWANWASCLEDAKRFDEALVKCQHALEISPKYLHAMIISARCRLALGKKREALDELRAVLELAPNEKGVEKAIKKLEEELKA